MSFTNDTRGAYWNALGTRMPEVEDDDFRCLFYRIDSTQQTMVELKKTYPSSSDVIVVPQSHAMKLLRGIAATSSFSNAAACHLLRYEVANKTDEYGKLAELLYESNIQMRKIYAIVKQLEEKNPGKLIHK